MDKAQGTRILITDDDDSLHVAYRRVLDTSRAAATPSDLEALSAELFGAGDEKETTSDRFDLVFCHQGEEAVAAVEQSRRDGLPFSILFLDMRMPPGIDGLETARRVRLIDPFVNIVIVTGYSDHKPAEITAIIGRPDRLFYLLKPFDGDEVRQLATALSKRWKGDLNAAHDLAEKIAELERVNAALLASEAHAKETARKDPLTGLSNRMGLAEQFDLAISRTSKDEAQLFVIYLDLDRFKDINDSLGHIVGDRLIKAFAQRVREVAADDGFTARLGGDEFVVICTRPDRVGELVERLLSAATMPFIVDEHTIRTSTSIGIAQSEPGAPNLVEAMRRADLALYAAKAAGRGVALAFDPSMEREYLDTRRLARDLSQAIAEDRLVLHYQPLIDVASGDVVAVEALLRWAHPDHGQIDPLVFIGVAEKSSLITQLGDWVLRRAFSDSRRWPNLLTAINLSPAQLREPKFVEKVLALAKSKGVQPSMIELEVTETVLIQDVEIMAKRLRALKAAGFRIALDDFGTGYSSIAYLSQLPFDKLKIDRSFVQGVGIIKRAGGVITSIISLAEAMGLSTTAEGVEDAEQQKFLEAAGCTEMQGFHFYTPRPAEEIETIVAKLARKTA